MRQAAAGSFSSSYDSDRATASPALGVSLETPQTAPWQPTFQAVRYVFDRSGLVRGTFAMEDKRHEELVYEWVSSRRVECMLEEVT